MYVFIKHIMCLIIFEEKAEIQDQYLLSLNPAQKADDPIEDRNRNIGPLLNINLDHSISQLYWFLKC